jgi:hypothetical protein
MTYVLRLYKINGSSRATGRVNNTAAAAVSDLLRRGVDAILGEEYLKSFDCEAHDGRGAATFTRNKRNAMRFASQGDALNFWTQRSKTRPNRPDGKPNRPLTVLNVTIEPID